MILCEGNEFMDLNLGLAPRTKIQDKICAIAFIVSVCFLWIMMFITSYGLLTFFTFTITFYFEPVRIGIRVIV